jgi:RNA polymerase sigma factor (TIGR02999 family)
VARPSRPLKLSEVTRILSAAEGGQAQEAEHLLPLVYDELRRLAAQRLMHEKPGRTLQPTALVDEAYLRLVDTATIQRCDSLGQFFAAVVEVMRRILFERVRRRRRLRHGGWLRRLDLFESEVAVSPTDDEPNLLLDEGLDRLAAVRPQAAVLVKLRFFSGLTAEQAAPMVGLSPRSTRRRRDFALASLQWYTERSAEP